MFKEVKLIESFRMDEEEGFGGVEFMFNYELEDDVIERELKKKNIKKVILKMNKGDWDEGERGMEDI